ncbi:MAG TPA: hypothetical protein VF096_14590 [Azonexus sp.]
MSLVMSIVTTANRTRRFTQTDPAQIAEILGSLKRAAIIFSARSLVVAGEHSTELFSPRAITRIEIETALDLSPYLPPAWVPDIRALGPTDVTGDSRIDDQHIASRVDCFFEGGDTLATWIESGRPGSHSERSQRLVSLFEQPLISYLPSAGGIGLINPANLTRLQFATTLSDPPAGAWHLREA